MAVWWGLLSAANGNASGFPVHVFGGEHAHVPIVPEAGALVAGVIVERGISAVVDLAHFTRSDQVMFSSAFAERFYDLQVKVKRPVHMFFEEAHQFLPQNLPAEGRGGDPRRNPAVMLNRMERIVRMGRSQGIGCSMITQQPQAVNKAALNQAGTLLAMRTMGKHERKAIGDWMADKATDDSQLKLDQLLPKLGTGEAWVASPHFLGLFKHTRVSKKTTFDSSATPKFGVKLEAPKVLADVDVEALRESMKTVVEQVEKEDPAVLRRRIADLERQVSLKATGKTIEERVSELKKLGWKPEPTEVKVPTPVLGRDVSDRLLKLEQALRDVLARFPSEIGSARPAPEPRPPKGEGIAAGPRNGHAGATALKLDPAAFLKAAGQETSSKVPSIEGLDLGARKMLVELAAVHPRSLTRRELALRAVLSPGGSSDRTYRSQLKVAGLIADSDGGDLVATPAGLEAVKGTRPVARGELVALWGQKLDLGARKMLTALLETTGPISKAQLAELADVTAGGSSDRTYRSQLTSVGLAEKAGGGLVAGHALFIGEAP